MEPRTNSTEHSTREAAPAGRSMPGRLENRGVALVITLLLLFLMSVLGLAAVLSTSSDLLINGYYANYRGSFYAADSGLTMVRQSMENYLTGLVPSAWNSAWTSCTGSSQPITSIAYSNPYSSTTYLTNGSSYGAAANSWAESFKASSPTLTAASNPCEYNAATETAAPFYQYFYNYTITTIGMATGYEQASITETGTLILNISGAGGSTPTNVSFSAFGAFINSFPACDGPLVYGTITGPVYANGNWNLGSGGSYTFTDPVNQTGADFSYWVGNKCTNSASVPFKSGGTTINPTFEAGYNLSQSAVTIPANDYSQRWAVLDGMGCGEPNNPSCNASAASKNSSTTSQPPSNAQMAAALTNVAQTPYPTTGATSGVYLPYNPDTCTGSVCTYSSTGGGIYVEGGGPSGSATTSLTLAAATSGTYTASTFPTSTQCTASACQVITVAQTGSSTAGSPTVSAGNTTCSGNRCSATYTQTTVTTTPTTYTTITIDPTTNVTTAQTYVQTVTSTLTQTATSSCNGSSCTPSAPSSNSYNSGSTTNSPSNGASTDLTLNGVPTMSTVLATPASSGCTAAADGACAETMIYVDGSTNVSGPSSGAAVQNNAMLTVTANGNIQQTGNLTYATEPVTTTQNQVVSGSSPACCSGDPIDTLIPSVTNMNQVLGLFTTAGEFQLNPTSNGGNLETDGSIASISSSCTSSCGMIATPGNSVGTWTNIGGRVENSINGVSINTGNVFFDQRFTARTNFAPPWFPQTSISAADITGTSSTSTTITQQRVTWATSTGGQ